MIKRLLYGMFPRRCPICDKCINSNIDICSKCEGKLQFLKEPKCKKCGKPIDAEEKEYCMDCEKSNHLYETGIGAYVYSNEVKQSIYKFKYYNRRDFSEFYGRSIATHFQKEIEYWNADVIIPIPIHRKKLVSRGYNQAELFARELSKWLQIPTDSHLLVRVLNTKPQKELGNNDRSKNLKNAFKLTENVVKYNKVILVDDIYTTGSTIDACSEVLLLGGAKKIYFISLGIGTGI